MRAQSRSPRRRPPALGRRQLCVATRDSEEQSEAARQQAAVRGSGGSLSKGRIICLTSAWTNNFSSCNKIRIPLWTPAPKRTASRPPVLEPPTDHQQHVFTVFADSPGAVSSCLGHCKLCACWLLHQRCVARSFNVVQANLSGRVVDRWLHTHEQGDVVANAEHGRRHAQARERR